MIWTEFVKTKALLIKVVRPHAPRLEKPLVQPVPRHVAEFKIERPMFRAGFEKHLFYVLRDHVFPRYSLIANVPLTYILDETTLLPLLRPREREFLLSLDSHADFCVANKETLSPFLGIEVDSQYHGEDRQRARDRVKNRIFAKAGVPLLRIEPADYFHQPYHERCRNVRLEIIEAIGQVGGRYNLLVEKLMAT